MMKEKIKDLETIFLPIILTKTDFIFADCEYLEKNDSEINSEYIIICLLFFIGVHLWNT